MVQTAASGRLLSSLRSGWRVPAALQRLYADAAWLQQLAIEELRPRPGRIRTSLRMAFIAAVGTALMAALHIGGVLGPSTLWVALYASSALMTPSEGLIMVLVFAVTLIASVSVAISCLIRLLRSWMRKSAGACATAAYNSSASACRRWNLRELLIQLGHQYHEPAIRLNFREKGTACRRRPGSKFS